MHDQDEFLNLLQMAKEHLEERSFTYTTQYCFLRTWRSIYNFAISRGIKTYNADLGELYMQEKYGLAIGEVPENSLGLSPHMVQKVRAIRALTDFTLHGFIHKIKRGEKISWPDQYRKNCVAFINDYKTKDYSHGACRQHELALYRFVCYLDSFDVLLEEINAQIIFDYFKSLCHIPKPTLVGIRSTLLMSLRFFAKQGVCSESLVECVPRIVYHAKAKLSKSWNEEEIARMLNAIDCANPVGKRDYCIMAIAANYGIRTGDILGLTIDDIDWKNGVINFVQQKTGELLTLPLLEQIGKAIVDYWRNGRPITVATEIFVQHTLPYQRLSSPMAYCIFNRYFEAACIENRLGVKQGLHSLRHSLASRLLEKDTPLNVISNILGHVNSDSTRNYIRIDINQLRKCALEVPDYE
jgi:integrase